MNTTESNKPKTRTITLTAAPPVRVREDLWPIIARARRHDGKVECQANHEWHLTVRQHADGRAIVYGSEESGNGGTYHGYEPARAGELLAASDSASERWTSASDVAAAIRRVGEAARCSEAMIAECIADLPADDLDDAPASPSAAAAEAIP